MTVVTALAPTSLPCDTPLTDSDVVALLTDAHAATTAMRIVGSGEWLDAGRPVQATRAINTRALSGIVSYVPGDLVITVRAGTSLAEISHATAPHGQCLSLDPAGSDDGTIGATIATASSGPLALSAGSVRDLVLGLGLVTGAGTPIRVGGRVVKNVAGFDLVRLCTGAFGTLGVLTDASLRLHAKPANDHTYVITVPADRTPLAAVQSLGLRALSFQALEILNAAAAQRINVGDGSQWAIVVRVTGNASRARAQQAVLAPLGTVTESDAQLWTALRYDEDGSATMRVVSAPSTLRETIAHVERALADVGLSAAQLRTTPHRGAIRILMPHAIGPTAAAATSARVATCVAALRDGITSGSVIGERLPSNAWAHLPPSTRDPVSQRIRDAFDPHRVLNRGIFGEHSA